MQDVSAIDAKATVCVINLSPYDACLEKACLASKEQGGPRTDQLNILKELAGNPEPDTQTLTSTNCFPKF